MLKKKNTDERFREAEQDEYGTYDYPPFTLMEIVSYPILGAAVTVVAAVAISFFLLLI